MHGQRRTTFACLTPRLVHKGKLLMFELSLTAELESHLFDVVEPRHPCAGGLTVEDVQRRLAQWVEASFHIFTVLLTSSRQVAELHLDERFNTGKEVLGKHLATGQKRVSSAVNGLWADIEALREAQRKRAVDKAASPVATPKIGSNEKTFETIGGAFFSLRSSSRIVLTRTQVSKHQISRKHKLPCRRQEHERRRISLRGDRGPPRNEKQASIDPALQIYRALGVKVMDQRQ